eukprot:TRINITY_DN44037_c0_g1_i1.p1 TRINITY_DN44037_c0_g1~~TRINITY_DN44037_c0_g1_i1.p1  ORF type:complete len:545 (-),score=103.84 TRINITY_DN44037_c0_g1_i1:519-2153(-)
MKASPSKASTSSFPGIPSKPPGTVRPCYNSKCPGSDFISSSGVASYATPHESNCPFATTFDDVAKRNPRKRNSNASVPSGSDVDDKENVCANVSDLGVPGSFPSIPPLGSTGPACHGGRSCEATESLLMERDATIAALQKIVLQKAHEVQSLRRRLVTFTSAPSTGGGAGGDSHSRAGGSSSSSSSSTSDSRLTVLPSEGRVRTSCGVFERVYIRLPNDEGAKHYVVRLGEYSNVSHMGRDGTFGSLVSATRRSDNKSVIIKRQTIGDIGNCETSLRELACLSFLTVNYPHPNIIEMLDCWVSDSHLYIVEERHPGTLRDMIRKGPQAMTATRRFSIIAGILSALRHLHACGILHRDLKPSNIVIDITGMHPRVIDLGSGRRTGALMTTGQHVTTYPYRAPEEVRGETRYKPKVDLWSAGCILAEMVSCKRLFACQEADMPRLHAAHLARTRLPTVEERYPEQKAAGGLQIELDALDGLLEHNPDWRWDAHRSLQHVGQAEYHLRPTGQYVEKVYNVHDLRGMHRIIMAEIEHFCQQKGIVQRK